MKSSEERNEQRDRIHALLVEVQTDGLHRRSSDRWSAPAERLVAELWDVAVPTLHAMLKDGSIVHAGPRNMPRLYIEDDHLDKLRVDHEARDWLAMGMFMKAHVPFLRNAVAKGHWDSTQSDLGTYFVNACLLHKSRVVEKWAKGERELRAEYMSAQELRRREMADPSDIAYSRISSQRILQHAPRSVRPIIVALADGFTIADAARGIGISKGAARSRIFQYRQNRIIPWVMDGALEAPQDSFVARYIAENQWNPWKNGWEFKEDDEDDEDEDS